MKRTQMNNNGGRLMRTQRGMGVLSVIGILLLVVVGLIAARLAPAFYTEFRINQIVQLVVSHLTADARVEGVVYSAVDQRLAEKGIDVQAKDILHVTSQSTSFSVEKQHAVTSNLIGPVDVVIRFNKTFTP